MRNLVTIGEAVEECVTDPEIREMFEAFSAERGDWERDENLPDTVTCRVFAAAVFWASANRTRWKVFYMKYYMGCDVADIAAHTGHTEQYVRKLLAPVHYSAMCDAIVDGFRGEK